MHSWTRLAHARASVRVRVLSDDAVRRSVDNGRCGGRRHSASGLSEWIYDIQSYYDWFGCEVRDFCCARVCTCGDVLVERNGVTTC